VSGTTTPGDERLGTASFAGTFRVEGPSVPHG
jgi:hypothetical protein